MLLNILPSETAEELKTKGEAEAKQYDSVSIIFTDFKGFTSISANLSPRELVQEIHECYKMRVNNPAGNHLGPFVHTVKHAEKW